jgi:hypothetical protein
MNEEKYHSSQDRTTKKIIDLLLTREERRMSRENYINFYIYEDIDEEKQLFE